MSRLNGITLALIGLASCAPEEAGPISLTNFYLPQADKCGTLPAEGDAWSLRGHLDVAGAPPSFGLGGLVTVSLSGPGSDLAVGGTTLQTANIDKAQLEALVVQLTACPVVEPTCTKSVLNLPPYTLPIHSGFNAGIAVFGYPNIIGPAAAGVLAGIGQDYELRAGVEAVGHMTRSGAAISTGSVPYPIEVHSLGGSCTKPAAIAADSCVFPGNQLGYPACCDGANAAANGCK